MNLRQAIAVGCAAVTMQAWGIASVAAEGTDRCALARWFFNGSGDDEMGNYPVTVVGNAPFVSTCGSQGLFTNDPTGYGTYQPFEPMPTGTISFQFEVTETFQANGTYGDPIVFINSNRAGSLVGDFNVRLDPEDGKLWFVQEHPVSSDWLLKSTKNSWEPGACYLVEIQWGQAGRLMKITSPGYFELNSDPVVREFAFSLGATLTAVLSRTANSPPVGVRLNWLEVAHPCPPISTEQTTWGGVKSLYR